MEKKEKVLFLIDEFFPKINQAIRAVDNFASNIQDLFVPIVAVLGVVEDNYSYETLSARKNRELFEKIKKNNYAAICVFSLNLMNIAVKLRKIQNIPIILMSHTNDIDLIDYENESKFVRKIKRKNVIKLYNQANEVFVSSPIVAQMLRENGFNGKVSYIPLGSGFEKSTKRQKEFATEFVGKYELVECPNILLSIGNVRKTKRFNFALESLRLVKEKGVDFKYFIIGGGYQIETLEAYAKYLGLVDNVIFLGKTEDSKMVEIIKLSHLLLYPSVFDFYGLAKTECAEFAKPGLFIKDSFVSNEVFDGVNGYVSANNIEAYAKRIIEILDDKKNLKIVGQTAKKDLYKTWEDCSVSFKNRISGAIKEHTALSRKLKRGK